MTNIDQLLRDQLRHEDGYLDRKIDQWLAEDLTAEYDEMVTTRKPARRRWLLAGMAAAAIALFVFLTQSRGERGGSAEDMMMAAPIAVVQESAELQPNEQHKNVLRETSALSAPLREKKTPILRAEKTSAPSENQAATPSEATADSLDYYLARLEQSLDTVDDSIYEARAEQIIRADERLQRLVQKVYMNGLERRQQEQQAMYLKY